MANWYGTARSNYFKVKDTAAFKAEMAKYDVEVLEPSGEEGRLGLLSTCPDNGDWPSYNADTDEDFEFWQVVAPHLADGEVAVLQTIGAEKARYLTGHAVAINNTGTECWVNIDDIYAKAAAMFEVPRESITVAQY